MAHVLLKVLLKVYQMKNKNLLNEITTELLKEGFSSNVWGSGSGTNNLSRKVPTYQHGSPPNRGLTGSPAGINIQDVAQESEEFAKTAGKNKLYPLEQVDELLVNAFITLSNAEMQIHACVKNNTVLTKFKEKKVLLDHCYKKIKIIKGLIKGVSEDFDRITLS